MRSLCRSSRGWLTAVLALTATSLAACGSFDRPVVPPPPDDNGPTAVALSLEGQPSLTWDPSNGKTTVIVQVVARDDEGIPLTANEVEFELRIDDRPVDNESLLSENATELASSIRYTMVLDASYSMLLHDPPAFEPMKAAAEATVVEGLGLWAEAPGELTWSVTWFDEFIYHRQGDWTPVDIRSIPAPSAGSSTKLLSAVAAAAARMKSAYDSGIAAGPRDRHVMVVFSDGADNYSWFDNSGVIESMATGTGAQYRKEGTDGTDLTNTLSSIDAHPNLTVHTLGLGTQIDEAELQGLASSGGGVFLKNPSVDQVGDLFQRITREFTTVQTRGATMPLAPGQYSLQIVAHLVDSTVSDTVTLDFTTGDETADWLE